MNTDGSIRVYRCGSVVSIDLLSLSQDHPPRDGSGGVLALRVDARRGIGGAEAGIDAGEAGGGEVEHLFGGRVAVDTEGEDRVFVLRRWDVADQVAGDGEDGGRCAGLDGAGSKAVDDDGGTGGGAEDAFGVSADVEFELAVADDGGFFCQVAGDDDFADALEVEGGVEVAEDVDDGVAGDLDVLFGVALDADIALACDVEGFVEVALMVEGPADAGRRIGVEVGPAAVERVTVGRALIGDGLLHGEPTLPQQACPPSRILAIPFHLHRNAIDSECARMRLSLLQRWRDLNTRTIRTAPNRKHQQ